MNELGEPAAAGGSVTFWIGHLKDGDDQAAYHLWDRYFPRLVGLARAKLGLAPRDVADEEDVALSAFDALCEGAACGHLDRLHDRDDLWRLLVVITARKVVDLKKYHSRVKRGGGHLLTEAALVGGDSAGAVGALEQVAGADPTPEIAAMLAEEYRRRLDGSATNPSVGSPFYAWRVTTVTRSPLESVAHGGPSPGSWR